MGEAEQDGREVFGPQFYFDKGRTLNPSGARSERRGSGVGGRGQKGSEESPKGVPRGEGGTKVSSRGRRECLIPRSGREGVGDLEVGTFTHEGVSDQCLRVPGCLS